MPMSPEHNGQQGEKRQCQPSSYQHWLRSAEFFKDERAVGATEAKRIRYGDIDRSFLRRTRHVVQITAIVWIFEIDRRRCNTITDRENENIASRRQLRPADVLSSTLLS